MGKWIFSVKLGCDCILSYKGAPQVPSRGETLWCQFHHRETKVILAPPSYTVRCLDCRFTKSRGSARLTAEQDASKHRTKCPEHRVQYYDGHILLHTFTPDNTGMIRLPIDTDSDDAPY